MQLILIRHAETAWNRDNKFLGATDVELTDEGIQQAWMAAGAVAELKPDYLISSPLLRARMTAGAIAEKAGLCPSTMEELTEINLGGPGRAGRPRHEGAISRSAGPMEERPLPVCFPAGESMAELQTRVTNTIESFEQNYDGKTVAVVSHNFPIKIALLTYLGLPLSGFHRINVDLASISVVSSKSGARQVVRLNDTCHID